MEMLYKLANNNPRLSDKIIFKQTVGGDKILIKKSFYFVSYKMNLHNSSHFSQLLFLSFKKMFPLFLLCVKKT